MRGRPRARTQPTAASPTIATMEKTLKNVISALRTSAGPLAPDELDRIIRTRNREVKGPVRHVAKKMLLPYYQDAKAHDRARWESWGVDDALEARLVRTLQMKPRRTASGVATVTVLTKPWPCSSACLYCPNDVRMPKSYLHDEPACQRAERSCFDPYLQVAARLKTLAQMGHTVDKVELIVLGGTWSDYPEAYQIWFMVELFRALNEFGDEAAVAASVRERRAAYEKARIGCDRNELAAWAAGTQRAVTCGQLSYNAAVRRLYGCEEAKGTASEAAARPPHHPEDASIPNWPAAARWQHAGSPDLEHEHARNVGAAHRCVGLVVETRPDLVTARSLTLLRRLGCTKIQMGLQSLDDAILKANRRAVSAERIARAFELARAFGFKTHAHFMANLYGSTPAKDAADYRRLVTQAPFQPDEVKLYPCALVDGTGLVEHFRNGSWRPYTEQELIGLLATDMEQTPPFCRVSRMIRDISSHDIMAGNKKVNLRQLVDGELARRGANVQEIRSREIALSDAGVSASELSLETVPYETSNTSERFLQWVTPEGRIAGFLRLSLPHASYISKHSAELPVQPGEAMIREVHVYGRVAGIGGAGQNGQHRGLGRALVERACAIARDAGYERMNVISAIGTKDYYRHLGFHDGPLYQQKDLR